MAKATSVVMVWFDWLTPTSLKWVNLIGRDRYVWLQNAVVLAYLPLLLGLLVVADDLRSAVAGAIIAGVGLHRLIDILAWSFYDVIMTGTVPHSQTTPAEDTRVRSILLGVVCLVELIVVFAIVAVVLGPEVRWTGPAITAPGGAPLGNWFDQLFASWTTLIPFGTYQPANVWARVLTMAELGTGLVVVAIVIGTFIGRGSAAPNAAVQQNAAAPQQQNALAAPQPHNPPPV